MGSFDPVTYDYEKLTHYLNYYPSSFSESCKSIRRGVRGVDGIILSLYHGYNSISTTFKNDLAIIKVIEEVYKPSTNRRYIEIDRNKFMTFLSGFDVIHAKLKKVLTFKEYEAIVAVNYLYINHNAPPYPTTKTIDNIINLASFHEFI